MSTTPIDVSGRFRYTADLDLRAVNDAHILAIGRVPANSKVLDLGAADGSVASILKRMGCRVSAVEIDATAAAAASEVCEDVAVGDLSRLDLAERFGEKTFDVVLMLDILEHTPDPASILIGVGRVLREGGWAVISLPNVAHVSVRLALLQGRFRYTETGLLDQTHLRFFDRKGVDDLLRQAGWEMFDLARVKRMLGATEIEVDGVDADLLKELNRDVEALTYQFIVSAAPAGSPVLEHRPVLPAAIAQAVVLEAQERMAELEAEVAGLRSQVLPDLAEQLYQIQQASLTRRGHLKHLLQAMTENSDRLGSALAE